jgi:hypothetical protein
MDRVSVTPHPLLPGLDANAVVHLQRGVLDAAPVSGLTHQFYRYPARFSPAFAKAAIETFTDPGDLVVDPFVGGGTTLVEAAVLGRLGVGADVSALAAFISTVKVTPLTDADRMALRVWLDEVLSVDSDAQAKRSPVVPRLINLNQAGTWHMRRLLSEAVTASTALKPRRRERFARCLLLRTAQWALDGRRTVPTLQEFKSELRRNLEAMLDGIEEFGSAVRQADARRKGTRRTWCFVSSASDLHKRQIWSTLAKPKLILTSPPYAGVHVLYDRWQVAGRRETSAPFWITSSRDGHFSSYYTFGDRRNQAKYFASAYDAFSGVARLASRETVLVQLVGFSDPRRQLDDYLDLLNRCGFMEVEAERRGRVWRQVPNRKWHADQKGPTAASEEVVLVHRLRQ